MIKATIVGDSLSPQQHRLTTMLITFPRYLAAELNTHRALSKNVASSRAISFTKLHEMVRSNPFIPIAWQKNHTGMQGTAYLTSPTDISYAHDSWLEARDYALRSSRLLFQEGNLITKQLANRLLEPFMWHTVLISGTEWENFFELRCPQYTVNDHNFYKSRKDASRAWYDGNLDPINSADKIDDLGWLRLNKGQAEIHMMALAEAMYDAMNESTPKQLKAGEWHIPFEDKIDVTCTQADCFKHMDRALTDEELNSAKVKISTAMAARTSYTVIGDEKEFTYEQQIALHDRMAVAKPFHASPFEHCARAMNEVEYITNINGEVEIRPHEQRILTTKNSEGWCRNYRGFIQYRHILES